VLPYVLDPLSAMEPGAPVIHPEITKSNVLPPDPVGGPDVFLDKGNVDEGFAASDVIVEMDTSHHNRRKGRWIRVLHGGVGRGRPAGGIELVRGRPTRMHVSQMLEMPINKVRVISKYVGGQFGRPTQRSGVFLFTALLARNPGTQ